MYAHAANVKKRIKNDEVYYEIHWSNLRKAEKYDIVRSVPAEAGIYQLYYKDKKGKLVLFRLAKAWYGGLRAIIRERTDPILEINNSCREILENRPCYYRYTLTLSWDDMTDILSYYQATYFPQSPPYDDSGRYDEVYVKESSDDKIVDI